MFCTGAPHFWRSQWRGAEKPWGKYPRKAKRKKRTLQESRGHTHAGTHTGTGTGKGTHQESQPGFHRDAAVWDCERWKLVLLCSDIAIQAAVAGESNWTWSGNVVFGWGYHCSSLCIGCTLPWLLMLCRSTLLSSEWWTNRQWFSPRKPTVFYCFHVSCVCLLAARLLPVRHMQFTEYIFYCRLVEEAAFFIRQKKKNTHRYQQVWQTANVSATWMTTHRTWMYLLFLWYIW